MRTQKTTRPLMPHRLVLACILLSGAAWISGCGGGAKEQAADEDGKSTTEAASKKPAAKSEKVAKAGQSSADIKRKFLEDIPYDVFLDDPLTVAANSATAAPAGGQPMAAAAPDGTPAAEPTTEGAKPAASGGATNWEELITAQVVEDEINRLSNVLKASLQTVGAYNTNYLTIPLESTTIAALAGVARAHPGKISWKENAKYIAALAAKAAAAADGPGKKKMDEANLPFENIGVILAGSKPAMLPEVADDAQFVDFADFGQMMKRFERTEKTLTTTVNSEGLLKEHSADVVREASVLAAMTTILAQEGYGYSDDNDFKGFVKNMVDAMQKVKTGAQDGNFAMYDEGITGMRKACTECHGRYR